MQPDLSDTFCRYGLDAHMRKHEKYCIVTKHNKTTSPSLVYCLFQFIEIQEEAQRVLSRRAAPVKIGGVLSAGLGKARDTEAVPRGGGAWPYAGGAAGKAVIKMANIDYVLEIEGICDAQGGGDSGTLGAGNIPRVQCCVLRMK